MPILDLYLAKPLQNAEGKRLFARPARPAKRDTALPSGFLAGANGSGAGGFAAAKINRLTMDFLASSRSADQDLFGDNRILRARARKLALDNPFARKFLAMVQQNVVGPSGILMQAKVKGTNGAETAQTKRINSRIEEEWNRWCRVGRPTVDGRFSFAELQGMVIKNCAREGENLVKAVYGRQFNDVGFALQTLDNDQLDDTYMMQAKDGSIEIRMGVEVDPYRRPQGYWLYSGHPFDPIQNRDRNRQRIPAKDIIHSAIWERPGQTRGYTWMAAAIFSLNQYGGYCEAELVAARASAAKFLVIQSEMAEGFSDDEDEQGDATNTDGTQMMTANAGEALVLDPGQTANFIDPKHPTQAFRDFTRTTIRNIASGLLVSYPSLANDLEGVNFSSIRAGLLDERDSWRILQRWFIDHFLVPVFDQWLGMALLTVLKDITLSPAQREQIGWKARGWEWVDPLKDADAVVMKLGNGMTTYTRELSLLGLDFEELMEERAAEQKFIDSLGLKMGTDLTGDQAGKGVAAGAEGDAAAVAKAGGGDSGTQGGGKGK